MVKIGTDQARFLTVGLVNQRVIDAPHPLLSLMFANQWLNGF